MGLCHKTIEHGMQGRVYGIHSISVSAKDESEQDRIIALIKEADVGIVICPSAALSMPVVDGDMYTEARMLMECCRYYDLESVADWATTPPLHIVKEQEAAKTQIKQEEPVAKRAKVENTDACLDKAQAVLRAGA